MKKKFLCMLLSAAMVFTAGDFSALTLVQAEEEQTTAGENAESQEEAFAAVESTAVKQETAEDTAFGESEDASGTDTPEQESKEEMPDETVQESEEIESSEEISEENITETRRAAKLEAEYHTADEIREFLEQETAASADGITYAAEPDFAAPYNMGALSDAALDKAKAYVRQIRFIAGVSCDVELNDEYNRLSQAAAFVNSVNGELSHEPAQPQGMSEELYRLACDGAVQSSLAYTGKESSMLEIMNNSWMTENDADYPEETGFRRQILNPSAQQIGFGAVQGSDGIYSALYTADYADNDEAVFGVAWPAQMMPVTYFDKECFWSVSTEHKHSRQ